MYGMHQFMIYIWFDHLTLLKIQIETFVSQTQFDELEVWTESLRLR